MNELTHLLAFLLGIFLGAMVVCGFVSLYVVYGPDEALRSALYGHLRTIGLHE